MKPAEVSVSEEMTNGAGAAAILAAGVGAFLLAVLSIAADHILRFKQGMVFYRPTGPLSGVTTSAVVIWLVVWAILHLRWRNRTIASGRVGVIAMILLCFGLVLTFPPLADLF